MNGGEQELENTCLLKLLNLSGDREALQFLGRARYGPWGQEGAQGTEWRG